VVDDVFKLTPPNEKKEPWRCCGCKRLMYNLDANKYPAPGAPYPVFLNKQYPEVCNVCYEMYMTVHRAGKYWNEITNLPELIRPDPFSEYL
jgi:hypothetical protein